MAAAETWTTTCSGTYGSKYTLRLQCTQNKRNVTANTSNVTVTLTCYRPDGSSSGAYSLTASKNNAKLSVNGVQRVNRNLAIDMRNGKVVTLATWTGDIAHNSDGSKTVAISGSFTMAPAGGCSGGSISKSWSLVSIPRASSIASVTSSVAAGGTATVNISRASSSFTHEVTWSMGGYSYKQTGIGTSASFSIPMNWINAIPNSTSGTATVKVQTKNGSANIGSAVSKTFTITVPVSVVPSFNFGVSRVDGAVPASWGIYLKGKSKATATISGAAGSYSSTIKSYSISGGGSSTTGTSMTTGFLNSAGTVTFTAKVSDSRGRTTTKTASITVIDYFAPYVSGASVYRCNSAGTVDSNGTYFRAAATAKYASCNGKNGYTLRVRYKKPTDSAWSGYTNISSGSYVIVSGLSTEYSYDVEISIGDYFTGAIWRSSIPTAAYTMHFKKGGKGVAFGKAAEQENLLDSEWDARIRTLKGDTEGFISASIDGTLSRAAISGKVSPTLGTSSVLYLSFSNVSTGIYLLAIKGNHNPPGASVYLSLWSAILTLSCGYASPDIVCRVRLSPIGIAAGMVGANTDANFTAVLEGDKTQIPYSSFNKRVYIKVSRDNTNANGYQGNLIRLV